MSTIMLVGRVLRVLFRDATSLYTIARFHTGEGEITATGPFLEIAEGDRFELEGEWTRHPKYGKQFAVKGQKKVLPETASGMEAYLASGLFKGIGKKIARRIVQHFGDATLDILLQEPERVREVPGVGASKRQALVDSLQEYSRVQGLALFLQGHGVSLSLTMKIYQRYGDRAIDVVKENPYRLAQEVDGIGFLTADDIARKLGTDLAAPARIKAAVQHVLIERGEAEGHLFLPLGELVARSLEFLNRGEIGRPVWPTGIQEAIDGLIGQGFLVNDAGNCIYRREQYEAEVDLAERIQAKLEHPIKASAKELDRLIAEAEVELGVTYAPEQREAVRTALSSPLVVITGGPGTGKSTVLLGVLTVLKKLTPDAQVLLAAPTGRAARRMTEVTGEPAKTIHRLLGYNPQENGFAADDQDPLKGQLLVVDEISMVDLNLAAALFMAIPDEMRVLLVGDADQLPSVGMGNVLADLLSSQAVPVVRLTRIYRQAAESRIVVNAHRINQGEMPDLNPGPDFEFIHREDPAELAMYLRDRALGARDGGATLDKITVLTPMRKTETGVEALNKLLQETLNPARRGRPEVQVVSGLLRLGDKVMQRKNNYEKEVFNGSVGVVSAIREDGEHGETLVVTFDDDLKVDYKREELDQLTLAYACTIHKAQGSEYSGLVMIPVTMQHYTMLQRNLLYTALTRAKEKAVLVGTEQAVLRSVRNNRITKRYSRLAPRLRGEIARVDLPPMLEVRIPKPGRPAAAAIYVTAVERSDGGRGWGAVRVLVDGTRTDWSGAQVGISLERLHATALGVALQGLDPDLSVVVCTADEGFLDLLDQEGPAPDEVVLVRQLLDSRAWKTDSVERDDPMAIECRRLAMEAAAKKEETVQGASRRATMIGTLGDVERLPELYELLKHESANVRRLACSALGKFKQTQSLPYLVPLLKDPAPQVRQYALGALEKIGPDETCLEPLNSLLQGEEKEYNQKAAETLLKSILKKRRS